MKPLLSLAILGIAVGVASLTSLAALASERGYSHADYACTSKESWTFGSDVAKTFRDNLKGAPSGKDAAVDSFVVGYAVKLVAKAPEVATLGEYFMYRAFYELNLLHFADHGFNSILNSAPNATTQGIKIAALGCMNQLHRKNPSLGVAYNSAWALGPVSIKTLSEDQRDSIWQGMATIAGRRLFVSGRNAKIDYELGLLQGSGAYETFVQSIRAATFGEDAGTTSFTEQFLKYPKLPDYLKIQVDGAHLNLARVFYHAGDYAGSVKEFLKVQQQSNFFSRSVSDAAWAHMMRKNYSDAAGSAYNLMLGDLRKTFAPDAPVIISMALFENCHYKEALDTLALFKKTYDRPYRWLYTWYHAQKKAPVDLYPRVVEFLKSGSGTPEPIASEWIRSPVFIALQQELNLTFDEEQIAQELVVAVAKASKSQSQKLRSTFKSLLANFIKKLPENRRIVMEKISTELATRNNTMIASLVESYDTAQLIEIEIYNQAGEDIIKKSGPSALAKRANTPHGNGDGPPALDWGRFPADEGENSETWGDELGALKTDVTNICKKK